MPTVRDTSFARPALPTTTPADQSSSTSATANTHGAQRTRAASPTDATESVDATAQAQRRETTGDVDNLLPPPGVPVPAIRHEALSSSARSFSAQLMDVGTALGSSEAMLAAFLKLQMLDTTVSINDAGLAESIRSRLRLGDIQAAAAYAGVARAAGQQAARYGSLAQDQAQRANELSQRQNTEAAASAYLQAASYATQAADLWGAQASAASNAARLGAENARERAGAGQEALLRNEEENVRLANELLTLLSGERLDAQGRDEAQREMDEHRLEVAQLVLQLIDAHTTSSQSQRGSLLG